MFTANIGGPLGKHASFFLDFNRRQITDNALVDAVYVDPEYLPAIAHTGGRGHAEHAHHDRAALRLPALHQQHPGGAFRIRLELAREPGRRRLPPARAVRGYRVQLDGQQSEPDAHRDLDRQSEDRQRNALPVHAKLYQPDRQPAAADQRVGRLHRRRRQRWATNLDTRQHFELQNNTSILHGTHTFRYGVRARRESDRTLSPNGFGGAVLLRWRIGSRTGREQPRS